MPSSRDDLADDIVSFALARPAQFGLENFAGDPLVEQFVDALVERFSLDVRTYVSWECPPNVSIVSLPVGNALIRSERLDTLLVEFHRLQGTQSLLAGSLAEDVVRSQVFRWMSEFLIGYRSSTLAVETLQLRRLAQGLELGIWNPFRDETLGSIPVNARLALQCFSLAHELGHLNHGRVDADLDTEIDGLPIMSHLDYDLRAAGFSPAQLDRLREYLQGALDVPQLMTELKADLFAFDAVTEFLHATQSCTAEASVSLALDSCEALIFVYHCKEICRLLAKFATGALETDEYDSLRFLDNLQWVGRARAVARRAGITLTVLEGGGPGDLNASVDRIDAIILRKITVRTRLTEALDACEKSLLGLSRRRRRDGDSEVDLRERLERDPDLRLELYYLLIAFGCHGSVDVASYLAGMSRSVHRVRD